MLSVEHFLIVSDISFQLDMAFSNPHSPTRAHSVSDVQLLHPLRSLHFPLAFLSFFALPVTHKASNSVASGQVLDDLVTVVA
jgi:hypothetical protein